MSWAVVGTVVLGVSLALILSSVLPSMEWRLGVFMLGFFAALLFVFTRRGATSEAQAWANFGEVVAVALVTFGWTVGFTAMALSRTRRRSRETRK